MAATSAPSTTDVLSRAAEVAMLAASSALEAEQIRRLPDAVAAAIGAAGLHRILQPARWGGLELDIRTQVEAGVVLARACPSTGWVLSVYGMHSWAIALFPAQAQGEVWADPSVFS
jgi:3-hydroxy-9,10-secoandrosta-1,3,5(10)-triene-9,17-dione monooxygenase